MSLLVPHAFNEQMKLEFYPPHLYLSMLAA